MTDAELLELDGWIAEKFMGWEPLDFGDMPVTGWEMKDKKIMTWEPTSFGSFRPSTDPAAFALVKREIERRGWGWRCERGMDMSLAYQFDLFIPKGYPGEQLEPLSEWGKTEELAGCLAVKAAIEGMA